MSAPASSAGRRRTLLGVWAHPDDEAYLSAGLMAEWRRRGDRVVVLTATPGEHGTSDPVAWPPARLAARRRRELRASLAAVGVHEHRMLGLEDGTCDRHDGAPAVAALLAELAPDLVVTFGPDGMTGHPDHRAVSAWVTRAWSASRSPADLWFATLTPDFHRRWGTLNQDVGLWGEQPAPPCTEVDELIHHRVLPDDVLDQKVAALAAHASQTRPLVDLVGAATYREWWRCESFRAATREGGGADTDGDTDGDGRRSSLTASTP